MQSLRSFSRVSARTAWTSSRAASSPLSRLPNPARSLSSTALSSKEKVTRDASQLNPSTPQNEQDTEKATELMNASYGQADLKKSKPEGAMPGKTSGGQEKPKEKGGEAADQKPAKSSTTKDHGA